MPIVLKCKKGGERTYWTLDGGRYIFTVPLLEDGKRDLKNGGSELFMNEAHAKELIERNPSDFEVVPEDKWQEKYKLKKTQYADARYNEAVEKFPDIIKKVVPKRKIKETED